MFGALVMMGITFIIIGLITGMAPYVVRNNIHFGVLLSDHANQMPVIKKWKKQFFILTMGLSVLNLVLLVTSTFIFNLNESMVELLGARLIFLSFVVQAIIYIYFHRQAKALEKE